MGVIRISGKVRIARPAAVVFDFIADSRNEPEYNPAMRSVELLTGEPIGAGTQFRALMGRGEMPLQVTLTQFEPPARLGSHTRSPLMDTRGTLTFTQTRPAPKPQRSWRGTGRSPRRAGCACSAPRSARSARGWSGGSGPPPPTSWRHPTRQVPGDHAALEPTQIGDLSGLTAIVTGANSGIGRVTAATLTEHGARVILAVRNVDAGRAAASSMPGDTRVLAMDLASLTSVRGFAERIDTPVELLVNNAGVTQPPTWRASADRHELQFATNHLGHFALTGLLLPHLLAAGHPRVTTGSSLAHHQGDA